MTEQEAQKKAFEKWYEINYYSLSFDHQAGHEKGWEDALEWVKHGQEPVAEALGGFFTGPLKQMIKIKGEETLPIGAELYLHPAPQPDVAELVQAARFLLDEVGHLGNASPVSLTKLEQALAKWEGN